MRRVVSRRRPRCLHAIKALVYPVALGSGLPLFTELEKPLDLKLVRTTAFDGGVVEHVYRPA